MRGNIGDSVHIENGRFDNGAILDRFRNPVGISYSAIYEEDNDGWFEAMSCERGREPGMVRQYCKMRNTKYQEAGR